MAADIHALEIEFAKSPTLDACIPLCEAYLGSKRYMEAMVVCKKGIKNGPGDPRGRAMLARIYLEQGKLPKAQQEAVQVLQEFPQDASGREVLGRVMMLQGQRDEAVSQLSQALQSNPNLQQARGWLVELGAAAGPAAPAAAPQQAAPQAMPQQPAASPVGMPPGPPGLGGMAPHHPAQGLAAGSLGMPPAAPQRGFPGAAAPWQQAAAASQQPPVAPSPSGQPPYPGPYAAQPGGPPIPAGAPAKPLEHVDDFFAPDTLGFSTDASDIETAGPGRLTIVGFVPKTTGSIKTTIYVLVGVFTVAAAIIAWQYVSAKNTREINRLLGEVRLLMADDTYPKYKAALTEAAKILAIDSDHGLTLSAMAYAAAVLATDHKEPRALDSAKAYLHKAMGSGEENEFRVAARALVAYADRQYDTGIKDIQTILDKGGSNPLVELEAFRLMSAARPSDKATHIQLRRLVESVVSQARIYNFLGWYYYSHEDWSKADKNFGDALQNTRNHPMALLGRVLSGMGRGLGLQERVKDFNKDLSTVLAAERELSAPTLALAHFANGLVKQFEGSDSEANAAFKKAVALDSSNAMFNYHRGRSLLKYGRATEAVDYLSQVVAQDPNRAQYYKALAEAQILARMGREAEASIQRAMQLNANDVEATLLMGRLQSSQKNFSEAIKTYERVTTDARADLYAAAQVGISKAMRAAGDKAKAVAFVEKFLENVPDSLTPEATAEIWCELGLAYDATRNKQKAIQSFQVGIEQYRYFADNHYHLCRVLGRGGEAKEACKAYLALAPRGRFAADAKKRSR